MIRDVDELERALRDTNTVQLDPVGRFELDERPTIKAVERDIDGRGATLWVRADRRDPALHVEGSRILDLRISGPANSGAGNSVGIWAQDSRLQRVHVERWGHAGIWCKGGSVTIEDSQIERCWGPLGYGVLLAGDTVHCCMRRVAFDQCRHGVAATGRPGESYELEGCTFGRMSDHAVDVHGGADREDGTDIAGDWFRVVRCRFTETNHEAVRIRGRPRWWVSVRECQFDGPAVQQRHAQGRLIVSGCRYA